MSGGNGKLFYLPIPLLMFCGLQPILFWTLSWPRYVTVFVSLGWLFYRCNQVLSTPVEELVHLLGLEVPPAPKLVLVDLTSDSVSLYWKAPDNKYAVNKNIVRVNGITLPDLPSHQTAITIENLPPFAYYSIRVTAVNAGNFQATSNVLRVKTLDFGDEQTQQAFRRQSSDGEFSKTPRVVPVKGFLDQLSLNAVPPPMIREPSSNIVTTRRTSHRRSSPGPQTDNNRRRTSGADAPGESIQELTARLDSLRREVQEVEKQDAEEEDEFEARRTALLEEKESLRLQLKEKEDGSRKIKGSVTNLERANAAAQSKKHAQEKLLQQKKLERQKMRDDMARWDTEMADMEIECRHIRQQIIDARASYTEQIEKLRQDQVPELDTIKILEQRIKENRQEVEDLEAQKQELTDAPVDRLTPARPESGVDEDLEWSRRYNQLKEKLTRASADTSQALLQLQQTQFRYQVFERRGSHANFYSQNSQPENMTPPNDLQPPASQSGPSRSSNAVNEAPFSSFGPLQRFPARQVFDPPRTSSPFFQNRTLTAPLPSRNIDGMSPLDVDSLTGGALASPGASGLLPSNLLGDEADEDPIPHPSNFLPGLGALPGSEVPDEIAQPQRGPASPTSIDSGSRRGDFFFSGSPHASNANLVDGDDKRSLHSIGERKRSRLLGDIFSGRSRGKTHSTDGPLLGSLKTSESQSLPKAADRPDAGVLRPQSRKGASMLNSFGIGRRIAPTQTRLGNASDLSISGPMDGKVMGWNDQASSTTNLHNPWSRPGLSEHFHSRPTSVYSETQLARPGEDGVPLGWSASDALGRSSSTRTGNLPHNPWANRSSRRPSVAAAGDNTTQLSGSSISEEDVDLYDDEPRSPPQAPIGTRPKQKDSQLNPAAGVFTMFKSSRGDKDGSRSKRKEKPKPLEDTSTPTGRAERDKEVAPSIDGSIEDAASTHTGDSVPSTPGPSSARSESFMRKLTRKGSTTGKFNLSLSSSREGKSSGSFFRRGGGATPGLDASEEDAGLGRSVESVSSSPAMGGSGFEGVKEKRSSAFSLSSFKKRKGKGDAAPSISEASVSNASVDGDEGRESLDA